MDSKIRELTDKIFNEGVEKGKQEANKLIASAQEKSSELISSAENEAKKIIEDAEKKALEIKSNTEAELKLYADQTLAVLKSSIADVITNKIIENNIKSATTSPDFIKDILIKIVERWDLSKGLIIESSDAKNLEDYFVANAKDLLDNKIEFTTIAEKSTRFVLKPSDKSYKIEIGEEELKTFFKAFLRPKLVEMLF